MSNPIAHIGKSNRDIELFSYIFTDTAPSQISANVPKVGTAYGVSLIADYDDGSATTPGTVTNPSSYWGTTVLLSGSGANSASDEAIIRVFGDKIYVAGGTTSATVDTATGGDPGERADGLFIFSAKDNSNVSLFATTSDVGSSWGSLVFPTINLNGLNKSKEYYVCVLFYLNAQGSGPNIITKDVFPADIIRVSLDKTISIADAKHTFSVLIGKVPVSDSSFYNLSIGSPPAIGTERNCGGVVLVLEVG